MPYLHKVCIDPELQMQKGAITKMTSELSFKWISMEVLAHALLSTALSTMIFTLCSLNLEADREDLILTLSPHLLLGVILGFMLVGRVILGVQKAAEVMQLITAYNKSLRTIAIFSTYINETLTVAAGAELEKKAVANFRYELDRLLNLANFMYTLMLKGLKMEETPEALRPIEGAALESKVLSSVGSPTLMICKWIANIFDQQILASRVSAEQISAVQTEISCIMDVYHKTRAMQLAPMPASLSSFTYFFVCLWVYTACPIMAVAVLHDSTMKYNTFGMIVTASMSFLSTVFFFGLYEAGKLMEAPVKATADLIPLETLSFALSDDITNLTDDPDQAVPVFLSPE